mgnify:CR=1 FL=1
MKILQESNFRQHRKQLVLHFKMTYFSIRRTSKYHKRKNTQQKQFTIQIYIFAEIKSGRDSRALPRPDNRKMKGQFRASEKIRDNFLEEKNRRIPPQIANYITNKYLQN